jgi:hypothetical protein
VKYNSRATLENLLKFFGSFAVIVIISVISINFLNTGITHYVSIRNNYLSSDYNNQKLNLIQLEEDREGNNLFSLAKNEITNRSLLFCTNNFSYQLFCNDKIIFQNITPDNTCFTAANNYLFVNQEDLIKCDSSVLHFSIKTFKEKLSNPPIVYISSQTEIRNTKTFLITLHILNLFIFLIFVIICLVAFVLYRYKASIGCLIVHILFFYKVFEIGILSDFITLYNPYHDLSIEAIDIITFFINTYLVYYIFDINSKVYWLFSPLVIISFVLYTISDNDAIIGVAAIATRFFIRLYPVYKGYVNNILGKYIAYAMMVYEGFSQYYILTKKSILKDGVMVSIFDISEIGYIIYCLILLYAFIKYSIIRSKAIEEKRQEFERFELIKNIGAQLASPLKQIKERSGDMSIYLELSKEEQKNILKKNNISIQQVENLTRDIEKMLNENQESLKK